MGKKKRKKIEKILESVTEKKPPEGGGAETSSFSAFKRIFLVVNIRNDFRFEKIPEAETSGM